MKLSLIVALASLVPGAAMAYSSGINGRSTSGCGSCHGGGNSPTVQLNGPTTLTAGSQGSYQLVITGGSGGCSGLDISASGGTLTAGGPSEHVSGGEIENSNKATWSGSETYTFTATAGSGSSMTINACGLAGCSTGNSQWGLTSMTVTIGAASNPPTVQTPASASPSTITAGGQTSLTTLGAETSGGGESSLTYTWSASPSNGVTFGANNGTNSGKNCTATFASSGSYALTVAIRNSASQSVQSQTSLTVNGAANAPVISSTTSGSQTATSVQLAVNATDPNTGGTLTYAWSSTPSSVTFQNSSASTTQATFSAPGTYQFSVQVSDQGTASGGTSVTIVQQATTLVLTCAGAPCPTPNLIAGATEAFAANIADQFGLPMGAASGLSWTASGDGTIDQTGLFTAGATPGSAQVTATANGVQGQANVTVLTNPNPVITTGTTTVQWLQPSSGTLLSGVVVLRAAATDPGGITSVAFGADGTNLVSVATPSYEVQLDTSTLRDGSHDFTATATNAAGVTAVAHLQTVIHNGTLAAQSGGCSAAGGAFPLLAALAMGLTRRRRA